jgi:hypothetical protein
MELLIRRVGALTRGGGGGGGVQGTRLPQNSEHGVIRTDVRRPPLSLSHSPSLLVPFTTQTIPLLPYAQINPVTPSHSSKGTS